MHFIPYAVWMVLMMALPSTAPSYAIRSAATLVALGAVFALWKRPREWFPGAVAWSWGILAGVVVWALWVAPENFEFYRRWFILGSLDTSEPSPYDPAVCGWPLMLARLAGSAFVIPAAEELFFRSWLYDWIRGDSKKEIDWNAFLWCTALFAVEHNRILAGAMAGAVYGMLALRKGLGAAIIAHSVTNLILGLQVVATKSWAFW